MNEQQTADQKLNDLIAFLEKEIASQEEEIKQSSFQLKAKKAKLRQLKKVNDRNK